VGQVFLPALETLARILQALILKVAGEGRQGIVVLAGLLAVVVYVWNKPGLGGQVSHSPKRKISAWISTQGWAGLNGKYVLTLLNDTKSQPFQEYRFKCSTPEFAQMRETTNSYLSWSDDGSTLFVRLPSECEITLRIDDR